MPGLQRVPSSDDAADLDRIVAGAAFLWERLADPAEDRVDAGSVAPILARWEQTAARGISDGLSALLAARGLTLEQASRALSPRLRPDRPRPAWSATLEALMDGARSASGEALAPWRVPGAPLPFEDLLAPVATVAAAALAARRRDGLALPERCHAALQRALVAQAARIAGPTLEQRFSRQFPQGRRLLQLLNHSPPRLGTSERYQAFVRDHLSDGYRGLFLDYPVLGRLLATSIERWVETTATLLDRLAADLPAIRAAFAPGEEPVSVETLRIADSDPHDGGHRVVIVGLSGGTRAVYKPRDPSMDLAFCSFIEWFDRHRAPDLPDLLAPRVLARDGYGWVEFVEQAPCADREQVRRFYQRAGALLAIVHALRGTDGHFENVLAAGEHPVLVDPETLLHGSLSEPSRALDAGQEMLASSILRTGMLPAWTVSGSGKAIYDISALGSSFEDAALVQLSWQDINTDDMCVRWLPGAPPPQPNLPVLAGEAQSVVALRDALAEGYRDTSRWLRTLAPRLAAPDGPLAPFRAVPARVVLRPTRTYTSILTAGTLPRALTDGAEFSIALDALAYAHLVEPGQLGGLSALRAELDAMHGLDVPRFWARTDETGLMDRAGPVHGAALASSGLSCVLDHLSRPDDVPIQLRILDASLVARQIRVAEAPSALEATAPGGDHGDETLLAAALEIAGEIREARLRPAGGEAHWLGLSFLEAHGRYQVTALGHDLYNGRPGIAVFLAALHRITGRPEAREAALDALHGTRIAASDAHAALAQRSGIGGADGIGGTIWALATVSSLLSDPAPIQEAIALADTLTDARIAADLDLDVIGGCAGAIFGLLALHAVSPRSGALDRAARCGRHLLDRRVGDAGQRAWSIRGLPPSAGFAHGASGIALALARLFAATGEAPLRDAVVEALAFERTLFDPGLGNWRSSASPAGRAPSVQWCHGAPGIGIARIGIAAATGLCEAHQEGIVAMDASGSPALQPIDHLCCGNAGRIDALVEAGRLGAARHIAGALLARRRDGRFRLHDPAGTRGLHCGLFQGISGIGCALLRSIDPSLPSPTAWSVPSPV